MKHDLRLMEAILFAASEPVDEAALAERFAEDTDVAALIDALAADYAPRGVNLVRIGGGWCFRTAEDLAGHMRVERKVTRKPSRAAVETLAVIAYHQPVTRSEVEHIRGVAASRGTFDFLLEAGWIRPVGKRRTPGRPMTWGTTDGFLVHFGLSSLDDLPGTDELKATGLLDVRPASTVIGAGLAPDDGDAEDRPDAGVVTLAFDAVDEPGDMPEFAPAAAAE